MFPSLLTLSVLLASSFALPSRDLSRLHERDTTSRRVVQYVQTFHDQNNQPLSLLPLLQNNTRITHVNLAALHLDGNGEIHLNDNNPNDTMFNQVWSDVAQLQAGGIKVLFMIGGAAAGSYPTLCGHTVPAKISEQDYSVLLSTIKYHKIDGVDLDIEENTDISCPLAILQRLNQDLGPQFLMTMAPVASELGPQGFGLSGIDYTKLDDEANASNRPNGKLVSWYNAQFYNGWGDASSTGDYDGILAHHNWTAGRVVLGALDNPNDGSSGYVGLGALERVLASLRGKYATFGGVAGWEYYDAGATEKLAQPWQWVKNIGDAVMDGQTDDAVSSTAGAPAVLVVQPDPEKQWNDNHARLVAHGASFLGATWGLNTTDGNYAAAAAKLGVPA